MRMVRQDAIDKGATTPKAFIEDLALQDMAARLSLVNFVKTETG